MAATITGLKERLRTIGWLSLTSVGTSCEEEKIEWRAAKYKNICDNRASKRLSPEAVQIARRQELEGMDKLAVLREVPVEQCWLETYAYPTGTKWIDINKGGGYRVEIRSRLVDNRTGGSSSQDGRLA